MDPTRFKPAGGNEDSAIHPMVQPKGLPWYLAIKAAESFAPTYQPAKAVFGVLGKPAINGSLPTVLKYPAIAS